MKLRFGDEEVRVRVARDSLLLLLSPATLLLSAAARLRRRKGL